MKKWFLRLYPYIVCIATGTILFVGGSMLSGDVKSLVLGIAGVFFAIPCLYVIYESAQTFSNRKLNKELFEYAKMRVDREVLSMVNQLMKIVYPYEDRDFSPKGIQTFLSQNKQQIAVAIEGNEYLGFQVLKDWSVSEDCLVQILESPFILQKLDNDHVISVISLMKRIRSLQDIQKNVPDLYQPIDKKAHGYKIQAGRELNDSNTKYPDRYLLLKELADDKYQVADFGDFPLYQIPKLLYYFQVNRKYTGVYALEISDFIATINQWIELTGTEFIVDTRMFRMGIRANPLKRDPK